MSFNLLSPWKSGKVCKCSKVRKLSTLQTLAHFINFKISFPTPRHQRAILNSEKAIIFKSNHQRAFVIGIIEHGIHCRHPVLFVAFMSVLRPRSSADQHIDTRSSVLAMLASAFFLAICASTFPGRTGSYTSGTFIRFRISQFSFWFCRNFSKYRSSLASAARIICTSESPFAREVRRRSSRCWGVN